jgi:FMN phosphatase YigB (HAD superfamily)
VAKPAQAFFAHALAAVGVAAGEAVMIGDGPEADVAGAKRAGLRAIWLNRGGADWPAEVAPAPDGVAADLGAAVRMALAWGIRE